MEIADLITSISEARWFSNLGRFHNELAVTTLESIPDNMEWLPTARDMEDPVHKASLGVLAVEQGRLEECQTISKDIHKRVLAALRHIDPNPLLKTGPHDLTEAAKGASLYAFRGAVWEIILDKQGFWCELVPLYVAGNWPCGLMPNKALVVF
jgi:hypothetical protein